MHPYVHSSTVHDSQKVETVQMPINSWIAKQIVVYTCCGLLFKHKKVWSTDTCYNVDEPQKIYAKGRKPDTKGHMLYDSMYLKYP